MQAQYRNYPITNQRSPHAPTPGRRNPGPPPVGVPHGGIPPAQMQQHYNHADMQRQRHQIEEAKRRARKPVDKNVPTGIEEIAIGDGVKRYEDLQEVERRLDSVMMRKRLDIQDSVHRTPKLYKTMRIWISNTVENQPWQASGMDPSAFDFSSDANAVFRVKIQGRLLNEDGEPIAESEAETNEDAKTSNGNGGDDNEPAAKRTKLTAPASNRRKLSHFFKGITINFDRSKELQPDGYTQIEWKRPERGPFDVPGEADFDCLEFERKSDENINITINFSRDESPERYKLKAPLAELLDKQEDDRHGVLMGLWEYIKAYGLQADDESRRVLCDEPLQKVFGTDTIFFPQLPEMLKDYLDPLPPIALQYTIRVDREFHESGVPEPTVYDIPVPVEDPLQTQMRAIIQSKTHHNALRDLVRIDDRLVQLVQAMTESKAKHDFFTSLSLDPANFLKRWISSQKRDLDIILGGGAWNNDDWESAEWRKGGEHGPWGSKEAWEGVGTYISRTRAGHDFK